ncbi:MAG TPA: ribosome small subunit-dependent GTPase A [Gemmatimonadales bacterium]|jgi:ribosome biogenesis GTPase|nr:ribosome small subunit-dependent GTPase A [Gemmatimonadales bacterium]
MVAALTGTVLAREGGQYRVATPAGEVPAVLRGRVKQGLPKVVAGDRVSLEAPETGPMYAITGVEPRRSLLARRVPGGRGLRPVAANVDEVLVVSATAEPDPVPQLMDRLLVVAAASQLPAAVVLTKVDLDRGEALGERFARAGYPVYRTSARTGEGLAELAGHLAGRVTVVAGPSGAGKSTLLNALQPGLSLRTSAVSRRIGRGKQTTVSAVMVPFERGGFIVDTPGMSEVGLWGIEPRDLASCFPEMRPFLGACRFADCLHAREPDCAIAAAAARGEIQPDRLESYRVLLRELEELPEAWE